MSKKIFIGTDSGATTTKFSGVWENGEAISTKLLQSPTSSEKGRDAVINGWIAGIGEFLAQNNLQWAQVQGVGLAIPGPYERYGVFGKTPNLPASFSGWDVYADYNGALAKQAGRAIPLVVGNDGNYGGVAEAQIARGKTRASAMMLMPGSGLGAAFVGADGLALEGDTIAGMEAGHMPTPLHLLGLGGSKTVSMRLRSRLGLRRGLHDHLRFVAAAGGKVIEISRPRTRQIHRAHQGKSPFAPQPCAEGRRPRRGDL